MQTQLSAAHLHTPQGQEADAILRACVHCGFCTATCPTYQLLADELDGPRGRIYLIKQVLEGQPVTANTQLHLDRCLTCRACETTCPSGVRYGRLLEIGRTLVDQAVPRSWWTSGQRFLLRSVLSSPRRFAALLWLGRLLRPWLSAELRAKLPPRPTPLAWPSTHAPRVVLGLAGCAQSVATPNTNAAAAQVLARLGIRLVLVPNATCCGAVSQHLGAAEAARAAMRRNIDAWWPSLEAGAEAIVISASACALMVKEYGHWLRDDPAYAAKAQRVSALAKDLSEVLRDEPLPPALFASPLPRVAFHSPCTLQHGQSLNGVVEGILSRIGFPLTPVPDSHLCCGSAGTYSLLQPQLSQQLLTNKLRALHSAQPEFIATANIGCQLHLSSRAERPVLHWIELLAAYLREA